MSTSLSYVITTPATLARSRLGGLLSHCLLEEGLELVGAQIFRPDEALGPALAKAFLAHPHPELPAETKMVSDYLKLSFSSPASSPVALLLFSGENLRAKLTSRLGPLLGEPVQGSVRNLYATVPQTGEPLSCLDPVAITPHGRKLTEETLRLLARSLVEATRNDPPMMIPSLPQRERTLVILKPDNWESPSLRAGAILDLFARTGLQLVSCKIFWMSVAEARRFYAPVATVLQERVAPSIAAEAAQVLEQHFALSVSPATQEVLRSSFGYEFAQDQFQKIISFMTGHKTEEPLPEEAPGKAKSMVLVYDGEKAVEKVRTVLGPTDPKKAPGGTVRREFGRSLMINAAHASDSVANAIREAAIVRIQENSLVPLIEETLRKGEI